MIIDEAIVEVDDHKIIGRRCAFADFKQRRLERLIRDGRVELIPIDEYLSRHSVDVEHSKD